MKFIILGCGSSMGVPRPDGFYGNCDPNNKKNYRTRCSALLQTSDENILIETDSPFLAPVPNRGKKNEPSFINYTANKLAEIKKTSVENFAKITRENSFRLFPKLDPHNQNSKLCLS